MKRTFKALLIAGVLAALALALPVFQPVIAATQNVTPAAGQVVTIPILVAGQRTATQTAVARFAMPFPCNVLGVSASARASGGTSPTLTIDVMAGGVSILSTPVSVTAGSVAEATVTTAAVADEAVITVNTAITGTSPTWDDIMVFITVVRK
jgi:hypothetical protein